MSDNQNIVLLQEEVLQLRADVERHKRMLKNKDDMIEEMEFELSKKSKCTSIDKDNSKERELSEQIRQMHLQLEDRDNVILQNENLVSSLQTEIDRLLTSNRELVNRTFTEETIHNNSTLEDELARCKEENVQLLEISNKLDEENDEAKKVINQLKEELEEALQHMKSLEHDFNECREEKQRLEGELFAQQNSGLKTASRGNSIFVEAMEAERRLEKDLVTVYNENMKLRAAVKRLEEEKEEAEMMAIGEVRVVSQLSSAADYQELIDCRRKIAELVNERRLLWDQFFEKIKNLSNKDIGSLTNAYFDGFKCSIEQLKGTQEETFKANERLNHKNRNLMLELEGKQVQIERLKAELNVANRRMYSENLVKLSRVTDTSIVTPKLSKTIEVSAKPEKDKNPFRNIANQLTDSIVETPKKKDESADEWLTRTLAKREAAKKERESSNQNGFVKLRTVEPKPAFKASRLTHLSTSDNK